MAVKPHNYVLQHCIGCAVEEVLDAVKWDILRFCFRKYVLRLNGWEHHVLRVAVMFRGEGLPLLLKVVVCRIGQALGWGGLEADCVDFYKTVSTVVE